MAHEHLRIMLLFMLSINTCHVSAEAYDPLLLRAQASIFPKIVLLDKGLASKTIDDEIIITIVSSVHEVQIAEQLQKAIEEKYNGNLGNKKITVNLSTFDHFDLEVVATAYIVLHGSELLFRKVVSHAIHHARIVFSYNYTDFKYDALISMRVKEKTYIYINKSMVQSYGISFFPVFYKIAKIIE